MNKPIDVVSGFVEYDDGLDLFELMYQEDLEEHPFNLFINGNYDPCTDCLEEFIHIYSDNYYESKEAYKNNISKSITQTIKDFGKGEWKR